ncbi:tail fiber assembly protein [Enterobacter asburiae]|uniref:tail fiber assembly protein n=1 Tax=Enterobacter asburiae TaxID=61645 RepID=UPI00197F8EC2|nr:tail fiber assembly protein [Enterobacter asburiae]MBN4807372.1 tail fiber assembly protein [Enterobacter asburiae]
MFYYSKKTNAFYFADSIENYKSSGTWPADAIEIDDDTAEKYMHAQPEGKIRIGGSDGKPTWKDIPPPTQAELISAANAEKQSRIDRANAYMNSKQWPGKAAVGRLKGEELAQYNLWLDYLDALDAVDTSSAPDIAWPTSPEN